MSNSEVHKRLELSRTVERTQRFIESALRLICEDAEAAVEARGEFRLSLCGGSTPGAVYEALGKVDGFPWDKTIITFGDERCYPPDHERSNFRMAKERLLSHVPLAEDRVVRMRGELGPEAAAERCEADLKAHAGEKEEMFEHDLILLGMGDDGHTASLFPETTALAERERMVVSNYVPKLPRAIALMAGKGTTSLIRPRSRPRSR